MIQSLNCPNCNAPLEFDEDGDQIIRCPYCKSNVVVSDYYDQQKKTPGKVKLPPETAEKMAEITQLVSEGKKIEAIKIYQKTFNTGLKAAKDAVEQMERGIAVDIPLQVVGVSTAGRRSAEEIEVEIRQLLQQNKKIDAIKLYRQEYNLGLKQSKEAIERLEATGQLETPQSFPVVMNMGVVTIDLQSLTDQADQLGKITSLAQEGKRDEAIRLYRQTFDSSLTEAEVAVQRLAEGQSITFVHEDVQSQAAIQPAIKVAAGATGIAGCLSIGITIAVVLLVAVIVLAALASSGGPLFETWSKINPIGFARLESSFGEEGSGSGYLTDPRSIAVEAEGNIYVGEYQGGRIQKFDATGKFLSLIPGEKDRILQNLATDRDGLLYAAYDGDINRIDSSTGEVLGIVAHPFEYAYFEDVVATPEGGLLSIVDSEDVVRFNPSGELSLFITDSVSTITQDSELEARVAVDGMGNIYVLGGFNSLIMKYSPEGRYLTSFGGSGDGPGQFNFPYAIAVDAYGRVFVSDGTEIHVFDSNGRFLEQFSISGAAFGMTFDDQNKLYIVTNAPKVFRYAVSEP